MPQAGFIAFFKAIWAYAWVRFVVQVAVAYAIGKLTAKSAYKQSFSGVQTTSRNSLEYRKYGYGEALIGGTIFYNNTHGPDNEFLDFMVAFNDHLIEELLWFRLDDRKVDPAQITWTPPAFDGDGGSGNGTVTMGIWTGKSSEVALYCNWMMGYPGQPANTLITSSYAELGSTDRARGVFHAWFGCVYNKNTQDVWERGAPQQIVALSKQKLIYDRRRYALNADPNFATLEVPFAVGGGVRWFRDNTQSTAVGQFGGGFTASGGVLQVVDNDTAIEYVISERVPVDTAKQYVVTADLRNVSGNRQASLSVAFYDSGGSLITASGDSATGWASKATYFNAVDAFTPTGSFVTYSLDFGVGGTAELPQDTTPAYMSVVLGLTRNGSTNTTQEAREAAVYEYTATRHDVSDETTWEYNDNPANAIADYLINYMGVDPVDGIDWELCVQAAQDNDVVVSVPDPVTTQKRFTCNGGWTADTEHEKILDDLKNSMAGLLIYTGGKWCMWSSVWRNPDVSFDEDALAGDLQIQGSASRGERYNIVRGFYADPDRDYVPVEFYPAENSAYLTRDGGRILEYEMDLAFVNSEYQAQRVGIRKLEQFDNQLIFTAIMNEQGAKCYPGRMCSWTISECGWTDKAFRCIEWKPNGDGNFEVTFVEDYSSRYDDPTVGEYTTRSASGAIVKGTEVIPAPTNLAATGGAGFVKLTWDNPPPNQHDYVEVWRSDTDDVGTASKVAEVYSDNWTDFTGDTTTRYYWVRSVLGAEKYSAYEPDTTAGVSGVATAAGLAEWYYIKPIDGIAIQNGSGQLTLEAHFVSSGVDTLLSSGTVQLYVGTTLVTVANGYYSGSDGYTGVFDAGDIGGSVIVVLKDGSGGQVLDSITLVDVLDGSDGAAGADSIAINYTNNSHAVPVTNAGIETWTGSGGKLYAFEGPTALTLDTNTQGVSYPVAPGRFRCNITKVSGDTLTEPAITGSGTTEGTLAAWAGDLTTATVYQLDVYVLTSNSVQVLLTEYITLSPSDQGADGSAGSPGSDGADGADAIAINYTNNSHAVPVTNTGAETWTGSGGKLYAFEGASLLTLSTNTQGTGYPGTPGQFRLNITKVSGDTLTEPSITGSSTTTATLSAWAGNLTTATVYQIDVYVLTSDSQQVLLTEYVTLSPSNQGSDGSDGANGTDGSNVAFAIIFQRTSTDSAPAVPSATATFAFSTGNITGLNNGWTDTIPAYDGTNPYLWVTSATASGTGATDTIGTGEWATSQKLSSQGELSGNALNFNRTMSSIQNWFTSPGGSTVIPSSIWSIDEPGDGPVWETCLKGVDNSDTFRDFFSPLVAIDPTKKHRVSVWVEQPSGDRHNYLAVAFLDSSKANISGIGSGALGWTNMGGYFYWRISNAVFPTIWTKYTYEFGGDSPVTIPSGAVYLSIGALCLHTGATGTNTTVRFNDYKVEELANNGPIQLLPDPTVRLGSGYWDDDQNFTYIAGGGVDGDALQIRPSTSQSAYVYGVQRRGPFEYDVLAQGKFVVEARWRVQLFDAGAAGSWTQYVRPVIRVTDEDGSNVSTYFPTNVNLGRAWTDSDTEGVWYDQSCEILVEDSGSPPRFIQVGIYTSNNAFGPYFYIDRLEASIRAKTEELTSVAVTHATVSSSSGVLTIDLDDANSFTCTLTENITSIVINNWKEGTLHGFDLEFIQDSTARTITIPSSWKSPGGVAYSPSTGSGQRDRLHLESRDQGTTVDVTFVKNLS